MEAKQIACRSTQRAIAVATGTWPVDFEPREMEPV